MMSLLRKIIPKKIFKVYHYTLAMLASFLYRNPSAKMIVIGVTGTSGKSTTVYLISKLLEAAGYRVGAASTILFKIGKKEIINNKKMTMVGRFALQRMLAKMAKQNCQYAIIETSSQGIEQFRHLPIIYDTVVFTNLYPEHIEAHGGFENYKQAKLKLFAKLKTEYKKVIAGTAVPKTIIANIDDEHATDFLAHWADQKIGFTVLNGTLSDGMTIAAENAVSNKKGICFDVDGHSFRLPLLGDHNIYNALAAIAVGKTQGISLPKMAEALGSVNSVPGRIEFIDQGQNFIVIVDYAFEPKALQSLYNTVKMMEPAKIIHVVGSAGGGRDTARRPLLGKIAGQNADIVIVTNEDPYDEDPKQIIEHVSAGAKAVGKRLNKDLFELIDRRQAIKKALKLATEGDIVLITGKGSEQAIVTKNNKLIPWDDRQVVIEELNKLKNG